MEKARKALFVDRDGTINRDCPYCKDVNDLEIYEDTVEIMKEYQDRGYLIIIITNQSGIARGYFTVKELDTFNNALLDELKKRGVFVDALYYCPHHPDEGCNCRKPSTGLIERAIKDFEIDISKSIMIGDRDDIDGKLARALGMNYKIISR